MQWIAHEMDVTLKFTVFLSAVFYCNGVSIQEQLAHIARRFNEPENQVILGAPSYPNQLPEAEPILPGHTLIRPSLGMLKSAVKFPHRDMDNGAGVYGNFNSLGLRYDSRNERVMYSGFRRTPTDLFMSSEEVRSPLRQLKKDYYSPRNAIRKFVKIFPAKPRNKKIVPPDAPPPGWDQKVDDPSDIRQWTNYGKYGRPSQKSKRSMESRLYSSTKTLLYAKKLLERIQSNRQRRQQSIIVIKPASRYSGGGLDKSVEDTDPSLVTYKPKQKLLQHGKDIYNHIKINSDAPEHIDFLPVDFPEDHHNNIRNWWYYHQADFVPFDDHDN